MNIVVNLKEKGHYRALGLHWLLSILIAVDTIVNLEGGVKVELVHYIDCLLFE